MAQYAIAFVISTKTMKGDGKTQTDITDLYQKEIPNALYKAGFQVHPQGSLYHTNVTSEEALKKLMSLQKLLQKHAPVFCKYVRCVHIFRMEEWSDVTDMLASSDNKACGQTLLVEEEVEENDVSQSS